MGTASLIYPEEAYKIVGAAMEVHNQLGPGFLEAVYQEAMEIELTKREIPFESQKKIQIKYKDTLLSQFYIADLFCYDKIIVELKSISNINEEHQAQILNYLKATQCKLGILINFGEKSLCCIRFANTK